MKVINNYVFFSYGNFDEYSHLYRFYCLFFMSIRLFESSFSVRHLDRIIIFLIFQMAVKSYFYQILSFLDTQVHKIF